jgi:TatD DNase family protein
MLVDSHCHLDFKEFSEDFAEVLENAKLSNVNCLQTICTKISEFSKIQNLIEKYDFIYGSVGNHPCEVEKQVLLTPEDIVEYTKHPKIISIGETGLDYYHDTSFKDKQIISFINHITAARITDLPVIIHTREAEQDTLNIIASELKKGKFRALIHCFTASRDFAEKCLELGLYISVAGIVTFKNARELQETIKSIPLERLLVETDSPYLAPVPNRGKRNEPAFVADTAKFLAELKEVSFEKLSEITTNNFYELFSRAKRTII